jgi:hypothetical protein
MFTACLLNLDLIRYSTLFYDTLCYSTLLYATLRYSTLLYATLRYSTLLYATLTLRYSTLLDASRPFYKPTFASTVILWGLTQQSLACLAEQKLSDGNCRFEMSKPPQKRRFFFHKGSTRFSKQQNGKPSSK